MLELDDISEKEELENLEEGLAHELERPLTDEESTTPITPEIEKTTGIESPELQFIKDQIPVLPYCGCEPLHCYLQPQRPLSEIQISSVSKDLWRTPFVQWSVYSRDCLYYILLIIELCL